MRGSGVWNLQGNKIKSSEVCGSSRRSNTQPLYIGLEIQGSGLLIKKCMAFGRLLGLCLRVSSYGKQL